MAVVTFLWKPFRLAAMVSAIVCAGALATVSSPSIPTAAAEPCSDVELIFGRGTSEPPGIGRVGQALADALQAQLGGRTVSTYGVNYPATYDFMAAADGANDATNRVATLAEQCPSTRVVLGGYSQGAAIVDMLIGVPPLGNKVGEVGSAPPLPADLNKNIAAVAVFGNPSAKFGIPVTSSRFGGRAIDLCSDGDPICSGGRNPFAHTHYESSPFIQQAAGFIAGLV
ncbi:cutinase [Mycobacterium sp. NS-7484]|uniref:cutinase family protein n=1 Tax=unclassified Mycobacterium TaxID=2642494 RepID=UPI0007FE9309|nr:MULTISPECIES: cutinase family protein [unclassified Mycobacterium]OBG81107.1 cutinase [Mycobacterium sp. E802]OMB94277.1 cutinase [Mycobacterium sp. NS-7484]